MSGIPLVEEEIREEFKIAAPETSPSKDEGMEARGGERVCLRSPANPVDPESWWPYLGPTVISVKLLLTLDPDS